MNLQRALARMILSIKPKGTGENPEITFGWKDYFKRLNASHFLLAGIEMSIFIVVFKTTLILTPIAWFSIMSIVVSAVNLQMRWLFQSNSDYTYSLSICFLVLLIIWRDKIASVAGNPLILRGLPGLALREELIFRFGSESWNLVEKLRSSLSFGLVHLTMLVVPLGACLAIAGGSLVFLCYYLLVYSRTKDKVKAVLESSTVHTTHNLVLLLYFPISIVQYWLTKQSLLLWAVTPW